MTIKYGDIVQQPGNATVSGIGSQPGPGGGDGWQIVRALPSSKLPGGVGRYALFVSGKIGNIRISGAGRPSRAVLQVCLGWDTGPKSPHHKVNIWAGEQVGTFDGIPFQFLMLQSASPSISDPFFGATFTNGVGNQFCLWARAYLNGDSQTYGVQFDVTDVVWLWFDLNAIPSQDQLAEHYYPSSPVALSTSRAAVYMNVNQPGVAGEKWLHLHNVTYSGNAPGGLAPWFEFGATTSAGSLSGMNTKVGSVRWGMQRAMSLLGATEQPILPQGCFWAGQRPSGTWQPVLAGRDRQSSGATAVVRYGYVGINLANLPDVLLRADAIDARATCNLLGGGGPAFPTVYVPLERPATGQVSAPAVFAHGVVLTTALQSFDCIVLTNRQATIDWVDATAQSDFARQEGVSAMAMAPIGISPSAPDIQYRAIWAAGLLAPPAALDVADVYIVTAFLTRDPDVIPNLPGPVPSPVIIVPERQSAAPGSLPALPQQPHGWQERPSRDSGEIRGAAGAARSWPLGTVVVRTWSLRWSALTGAETDALLAFFRANVAFKAKPPLGTADVAMFADVGQLPAPSLDAQLASLEISAVELQWTG